MYDDGWVAGTEETDETEREISWLESEAPMDERSRADAEGVVGVEDAPKEASWDSRWAMRAWSGSTTVLMSSDWVVAKDWTRTWRSLCVFCRSASSSAWCWAFSCAIWVSNWAASRCFWRLRALRALALYFASTAAIWTWGERGTSKAREFEPANDVPDWPKMERHSEMAEMLLARCCGESAKDVWSAPLPSISGPFWPSAWPSWPPWRSTRRLPLTSTSIPAAEAIDSREETPTSVMAFPWRSRETSAESGEAAVSARATAPASPIPLQARSRTRRVDWTAAKSAKATAPESRASHRRAWRMARLGKGTFLREEEGETAKTVAKTRDPSGFPLMSRWTRREQREEKRRRKGIPRPRGRTESALTEETREATEEPRRTRLMVGMSDSARSRESSPRSHSISLLWGWGVLRLSSRRAVWGGDPWSRRRFIAPNG